jgi:hypothetical protein
VVTNGLGKVYPNVKWNVALTARTPLLSCVRENGLIVTVAPNAGSSGLSLQGNLHLGK